MPWIKRAAPRLCFGLLAATALLCGPGARAGSVLWYNGDFDGRDALENATNLASTVNPPGTLYNAFVYDNFIVPTGQTWTITNVFSNIQTNFATLSTTATWQILSGVSAGNGGTTVASGDGAATQTATGGAVVSPQFTAYKLSENIAPVVLTAGTYWLSVAPDIPAVNGEFFFSTQFDISTTSGKNAVGNPPGNDGNSFINTVGLPAAIGYNFVPTSSIEGPGNWDYSMGVSGTFVTTVIPEPSSLVLAGVALSLCSLAVARRRMTARAPRRTIVPQL
jgi:hypothetical protein